jgi:hypothetical protein
MSTILDLLTVLLPVLLILGLLVLLGYSLVPDTAQLAEARIWREKRRELNESVIARRVRS